MSNFKTLLSQIKSGRSIVKSHSILNTIKLQRWLWEAVTKAHIPETKITIQQDQCHAEFWMDGNNWFRAISLPDSKNILYWYEKFYLDHFVNGFYESQEYKDFMSHDISKLAGVQNTTYYKFFETELFKGVQYSRLPQGESVRIAGWQYLIRHCDKFCSKEKINIAHQFHIRRRDSLICVNWTLPAHDATILALKFSPYTTE